MSIHDRDYYRERDPYDDPRPYWTNRRNYRGWWGNPRSSRRSPFQIFLATLGAIIVGSIILWFARVAYIQWVFNRFQQQTMATINQAQQKNLAQQARLQQEQRQRAEAERRWKLEHPTMRFTGYQKVWVPGKPLEQCKTPGQAFDNVTVACINGYYENRPVYVKE